MKTESALIRSATPEDAAALCAIYNPYIAGTVITFEEQPVAVPEMQRRIAAVQPALPWLVAEDAGHVAGYAYAAPWRPRAAYRHSVESTIYLAPASHGRGLGRRLYGELLDQLRARGLHTVIGGVALPNPASVGLHEALGFKQVAEFGEVGFKFGRWINVGYWQLHL